MIKQPAQQPPEMAIGPALVNPPSNMISRAPAMNAVIPVMRRITFCLPTGGGSTAMTCIDVPPERIGYKFGRN
ncbi:hypothetical protein N9M06_01205 [Candidatus Poseidoniales archaeon]|nr:hypothetical protein [Candidatus Poseidoniales archaeon]|tara:strand:- start:371 stop:589 length:219 start_codon:yes stop_codon:yes gene_type:complete